MTDLISVCINVIYLIKINKSNSVGERDVSRDTSDGINDSLHKTFILGLVIYCFFISELKKWPTGPFTFNTNFETAL